IEEEQAAKAQNWKLPICYDDDDDEERSNSLQDNIIYGPPSCSAITPNEPVDSLKSYDEVPNPPPQCHFNIYSCQICKSNSYYGYECSQQVPLVYELEPRHIQNFNDNDYSRDFPRVNLLIDHHCCYECGNSLNDFFCYQCPCEFCGNGAHREEKQIEEEQAAKAQNWKLPICYDDDDDEERSNSLQDNIIYGPPSCSAITPNEPVDSLSIGMSILTLFWQRNWTNS
nr:hypothetical protein [Tanacetum cinerariifolium]